MNNNFDTDATKDNVNFDIDSRKMAVFEANEFFFKIYNWNLLRTNSVLYGEI